MPSKMDKDKKLRLLRRARDLVRNGWTRGAWVATRTGRHWSPLYGDRVSELRAIVAEAGPNETPACCLEGAVYLACAETGERAVKAPARDVIGELEQQLLLEGIVPHVPGFNDALRRTKDEVIGLVDRAIERLEREEDQS